MNHPNVKGRITGVAVIALVVLLGAGWPDEALAQSQTVTADGVAGIQGGDKAIARDNAIQDALRKAVEQAVGTMVASETMVENFV
ncbi:MAG TPA: hypothetical protein VGQ60_00645, partial [Nitrospiraceae bacterium]|nr:hypothetical protein [Nitrospiraceae bacterium]